LQRGKAGFVRVEYLWREFTEMLTRENSSIGGRCENSMRIFKFKMEPIVKVLRQLEKIYERIKNNPHLNNLYMEKIE
jgi:hypothetical protein